MNKKYAIVLAAVLSLGIGLVIGINISPLGVNITEINVAPTVTPSAYAALLDSEIRGLDQETIEGYLTGEGLGQALPAELNGYPGPRHTIDMAEELKLSEDQLRQMQALFDKMHSETIPLGEQYLEAVAQLELAFREGTITEEYLKSQLIVITGIEAQLRYAHLSTHLATIEILSAEQIMQYNMLRGYMEGMDHNQHSSGSD